ncbi:hypothetical protein Nmel_008389 [Mimus melanotis]
MWCSLWATGQSLFQCLEHFFHPCSLTVSGHWAFFTFFLNIVTKMSSAQLIVSALGSLQLSLTDPKSLFRS